jgi:hypothetical protein
MSGIQLNSSTLLLVVACLGLLVVGLFVLFGLQTISGFLRTIFGVFGILNIFTNGGPLTYCGCLALFGACGLGAALIWLVTTCSTNPYAMNFCLLVRGSQ